MEPWNSRERTLGMSDLAPRLQAVLGDAYEILHELPPGGMSRLFLANEASLERLVVVKVLPPEYTSEVSAARFDQEIQVAAHLQHPAILTVLAAGASRDLLYYVMPYVPGESLRQRLDRDHRLPVQEAVRIVAEIADALAYAHARGVIHRDVKPENILLLDGHAVLTDFGVARAIAQAASGGRLTQAGMAVGTPSYMAPEQAAGEQHVDARADVYALALVGYEMLAGKLPFEGQTARALLAARLSTEPKSVDKLRPETPPAVVQVLMRALTRAPEDRIASAATLRDALTGVVPVARLRPGRRVRRVAATAAVAAAVLGSTAYLLRASRPPSLDPDLVVVAPFDLLAPDLDPIWREGLIDILSRNLDGAGPLRTVSPTVVVRRWSGHADPASATALGEATGARLAVFGQLIGSGRDSVRLTATLLDVANGRRLGDVERRDAAERVDRLADSVTVALLRELERTRPIGAGRIASLGSASFAAVKTFLQGEQYLRRSAWDSAIASYERAAAQDPGFALAYNRLSLAMGWVRSGTDSLSRAYGELAGRLNHGLAPRDSLLLVADSIRSVLFADDGAPDYWRHARRLFATLEDAARRYPTDPSIWYNLGEAYHHFGFGPGLEVSAEETRRTFDRAIALDSAFAPSYIHPVELSLTVGDVAAARHYAERYLGLEATDISAGAIRLVSMLLQGRDGPVLRAMLDTVEADVLAHVVWSMIGRWADSTQWAVRLAAELSRPRPAAQRIYTDPGWIAVTRATTLAYRGRLREARALFAPEPVSPPVFLQLALLGGIPADTARARFATWLGGGLGGHAALPWWAAVGDTMPIRRFIASADSLARSAGDSVRARQAACGVALGAAYLALARGDSVDALARFRALPDTVCIGCAIHRLAKARLLAASGDDAGALALLGPRLARMPVILEPLVALERGRVLERLGDRAGAAAAFAFVAAIWREADPELQPYVAEARAALLRLGSEPLS